jgi:hypothetical protein
MRKEDQYFLLSLPCCAPYDFTLVEANIVSGKREMFTACVSHITKKGKEEEYRPES